MLNSSRRKRREEERRKREEKKKEDLTKYLKAAGLTVETKERKNSTDSRLGLTQNMEASTVSKNQVQIQNSPFFSILLPPRISSNFMMR